MNIPCGLPQCNHAACRRAPVSIEGAARRARTREIDRLIRALEQVADDARRAVHGETRSMRAIPRHDTAPADLDTVPVAVRELPRRARPLRGGWVPPAAAHPRRYPHWGALSGAVDLLTAIEETLLSMADDKNARLARQARLIALQIALGPGCPQAGGCGEEGAA